VNVYACSTAPAPTAGKGERRSMSEADYAGLVTAAHQHLSAPLILIWDYVARYIIPPYVAGPPDRN
jgi:hypothetical protein